MSLIRRMLGLGPKPDLSLYRSPSTPPPLGIPIKAYDLEVGMTIITADGTAKVVSVEDSVLSVGDIKIGLEMGGQPWFLRPGQVITIDDVVLGEIDRLRSLLAKAEAELAEFHRSHHRSEKGDDRGH